MNKLKWPNRFMQRNKFNWPLIFGGLIILGVLFVIAFPSVLTDVNPYGTEMFKSFTQKGGQLSLEGAPFPPSAAAPLGTDEMGRDILSLIVYGTKLTIPLSMLVVFGRFLVALPLGIAAGFGRAVPGGIIKQFSIVFSAVPSLLISILVLKLTFFANLDKEDSVIAFVIVLTFVGWAKLAAIIKERVHDILAQPFIKGEITAGKGTLKLALENVLPHLSAELAVLFFMEIARALAIIAQLGVFGVFVGNLRIVASTDSGMVIPVNISFEPEWASLLASSRNYFRSAPWMVLAPSLAFFISILGFNLFGEGLKRELQRKDSRFIVHVRTALSGNWLRGPSIWPLRKPQRARVRALAMALAFLTLILGGSYLAGWIPDKGQDASQDNAFGSWAAQLPDEVIIGSSEAQETALAIAGMFEKNGLQPLDDRGYVQAYETGKIYLPDSSRISVKTGTAVTELTEGVDYSLLGFGNFSLAGGVFDARNLDLYAIKDYHQFDGKFVLIDSSYYAKDAASGLAHQILQKSSAQGVLFALSEGEQLPKSLGNERFTGLAAWLTPHAASLLTEESRLEAALQVKELTGQGQNVLGVIPGRDPRVGKEAIMIGLGYNYFEEGKDLGQEKIRWGLALAKELAETTGHSIILAYWDGTVAEDYHGAQAYGDKPIYNPQDTVLYIDLTGLSAFEAEKLHFSKDQAPLTRYFSWAFAHQVDESLKDADIPVVYDKTRTFEEIKADGPNSREAIYRKTGIPTIALSMSAGEPGDEVTLAEVEALVLKVLQENQY